MASETDLITIIHISDLHIGRIDPWDVQPVVPWWLRKHPRWFRGLQGHDGDSLARLDQFFDPYRGNAEVRLIVTGDITSWGRSEEYASANNFLGKTLGPDANYIGLEVPEWNKLGVPGNHDHWDGKPIFGGPPADLQRTFLKTPYWNDPIILPFNRQLRFFGISTDEDVHPFGKNRFLARGAFETQITKLSDEFHIPRPKNEIRVLLLHHSSLHAGRTLSMTDESRRALYQLIAKHEIQVMMCGHTHIPKLREFGSDPVGKPRFRTLEACCGATTIREEIMTSSGPRALEQLPNSLLVHRLVELNGGVVWRAKLYFKFSDGFNSRPPWTPWTTSDLKTKLEKDFLI